MFVIFFLINCKKSAFYSTHTYISIKSENFKIRVLNLNKIVAI